MGELFSFHFDGYQADTLPILGTSSTFSISVSSIQRLLKSRRSSKLIFWTPKQSFWRQVRKISLPNGPNWEGVWTRDWQISRNLVRIRYSLIKSPCLRCHLNLDSDISSVKTSFSVKFSTGIWICTTGAQFVIGWWYRKAAIFYLPPGWFGPLAWVLAFPFAPKGKRCPCAFSPGIDVVIRRCECWDVADGL